MDALLVRLARRVVSGLVFWRWHRAKNEHAKAHSSPHWGLSLVGVFGVGRGGVGGLSEEGVGRVVGLVSEEWRVPYGPKPMAAVHPGMNLRGVCGASVADHVSSVGCWAGRELLIV